MAVKLAGPVGKAGRKENPVTNKADDIRTVRSMLRANGINVPEEGGADAGLVKGIMAAQTKAGFKSPDGIIDPGGRVFAFLLPKFEKVLKEAAAAEKQKMMKVKFRGKDYELLPKDYDKLVDEVIDNLSGYIKAVLSSHRVNLEIYEGYLDTAMLKDGYLNAISQAIILTAGSVNMPDNRLATNSISAAGKLERAFSSRSLAQLETALPEAERAINAFSADVMRFLKAFTRSAQTTGTVLQVTSAAGFAVVGALAAPVLITAGASAAGAAAISGAGVGVLSAASNELGRHASGQNVTVWESVKNVVVDGTIGAATGGIASKLPLGFVEKMAKGVAPAIAAKVPGFTAQQLTPVITQFLTGTGQETIKTAVSEAVGLLGKMIKSGKTPTEKDFDEAVQKVLMTALTAGLLKNLGTFQKKWAFEARHTVEEGILPDVVKTFLKGKKVPSVIMAKMQAEIWNKVAEEATKGGLSVGLEMMGGTDDPTKMVDAARKALEKDRAVQKMVEKEVEKYLKKEKLL